MEITQKEVDRFITEYIELCQKYGLEIRPTMGWKQQIDGTFTISLQQQVIKLPEQQRITLT